ncbi:phosphoglycerate mutase, putative [Theileria annulata]|uniref:phosphoglycerate mutase (2,3-diphosphoglycerate-dependent) n=1 Tax=Theileria annulata TaxID=5874 RepID=Q4U8Z5_THEAN|nr:phosphoglycerate mutase, putative [Theileria annulata]CAI76708.1 phosphoglycerate mutase, putative [Theileria annulata]|eukprot:XP_953333.1 phosphoglycerate mutase, putative [Theileria annulata]
MNRDNRFCGWIDVDLSEEGEKQARDAAELMRPYNFRFGHVYTSILKRSLNTAQIVLETLNHPEVEITRTWRLNERHYGALQGLDKEETAKKFGEAMVKVWRRSYDIRPPPVEESSEHYPANNPVFDVVPREFLPNGESLKLTLERVMPFWESEIVPELRKGKPVLVAGMYIRSYFILAHGNSLRGLIKMLDKMTEAEIMEFNLPTCVPVVYELNEDLSVKSKKYLLDEESLKVSYTLSTHHNQQQLNMIIGQDASRKQRNQKRIKRSKCLICF